MGKYIVLRVQIKFIPHSFNFSNEEVHMLKLRGGGAYSSPPF